MFNKLEPTMEFKDEKQAYECLKEWQDRLFLQDWTIKVKLVDKICDDGRLGECFHVNPLKVSQITLKKFEKENEIGELLKPCHEKILVHELLHLKYPECELNDPTIEEVLYNENQHALIEQMAKSLIMAKYNLTFDWFKNF